MTITINEIDWIQIYFLAITVLSIIINAALDGQDKPNKFSFQNEIIRLIVLGPIIGRIMHFW